MPANVANNPFLDAPWMPRYDAMTPEAAAEAFEQTLPKAEQAFRTVEKQLDISWQGLIVAPNEAVRKPFEVWGMLTHLTSVVNSEAWRKVEETYQPRIIALAQLTSQSRPLYEGMLALAEDPKLKPWQRHVLDRYIRSMRNAGVGLTGAEKRKFNRIQTELANLGMRFSNNVLDSEKAAKITIAPDEAEGIKPDLLVGKGPWELGIDFATYDSVMRYAVSSDVRERFWRARATRASSGAVNNNPLIEKIVKLRQQMADLLGYPDYAHVSTSEKMAGTPEAVYALLDPMLKVGRPAAKVEERELAAFAKKNGFSGKLQPWDKAYWCERLSQELFGFDEEALRDYFPMERVLDGLFALVKRLFGVTFERQKGAIHAWHRDVRFYHVRDAKGNDLAGFYFDPYARPGTKNGGAWMNEIRGRDFETRKQLPIAVVCCNQKPPRGRAPATMSTYEVETLFHEVGHALQEMLTAVDSPTCAGISNVEWDAVEIASQFLERFPKDVRILKSLSAHVKTGVPLPDETINAIVAKRRFRAANALVRQLHLAYTDLAIHAKNYPKKYKNANACKEALGRRILPSLPHPDDRFLCAFTHIFSGGYSAGYYSYKWSETLSADIYAAFAGQTAATQKKLGARYLKTILGMGGSAPAAEVFRKLMGRDPDASAILREDGLLPEEA